MHGGAIAAVFSHLKITSTKFLSNIAE